jgi:putative membrane protein (TIGR04086 family)
MATTALPRLEARSVLIGAALTIALAVPPAVVGLLLSEDDSMAGSAWVPFLFAWIVLAFFVGGLVAARPQPHAPLAHGALAALAAYVTVQGVGVIRHLLAGEDVSWLSIPFAALLASSTGTVGGIVANWLRARRSRDMAGQRP